MRNQLAYDCGAIFFTDNYVFANLWHCLDTALKIFVTKRVLNITDHINIGILPSTKVHNWRDKKDKTTNKFISGRRNSYFILETVFNQFFPFQNSPKTHKIEGYYDPNLYNTLKGSIIKFDNIIPKMYIDFTPNFVMFDFDTFKKNPNYKGQSYHNKHLNLLQSDMMLEFRDILIKNFDKYLNALNETELILNIINGNGFCFGLNNKYICDNRSDIHSFGDLILPNNSLKKLQTYRNKIINILSNIKSNNYTLILYSDRWNLNKNNEFVCKKRCLSFESKLKIMKSLLQIYSNSEYLIIFGNFGYFDLFTQYYIMKNINALIGVHGMIMSWMLLMNPNKTIVYEISIKNSEHIARMLGIKYKSYDILSSNVNILNIINDNKIGNQLNININISYFISSFKRFK